LLHVNGVEHNGSSASSLFINRETIMRKLSLLAVSVGAALIGTAVPVSFHLSGANEAMLALDTAEAKVGRPLTPVSVAGANRRANRRAYRAAAGVAAAGAVAAGAAATGAYYGQPVQDPYYGQPAPTPYAAPGPYYAEPAPAPYYGPGPAVVAPAPVVVAPAPAVVAPAPVVVAPVAGYVEPGYDQSYIVDYRTGRSCRIEPSGYRWCWTP
jgi:hypothetical protein